MYIVSLTMVTMVSNYLTMKCHYVSPLYLLNSDTSNTGACLPGFYNRLLMESLHFYKIETGHKLSGSGC